MKQSPAVRYRVLMADQDPHLLDGCRRIFPLRFWELCGAASGRDCLLQLHRFRPHVLVLEPTLPSGGASAVLRQMHHEQSVTSVPVILLTACSEFDELAALLQFPLHDFAFKPISPSDLAFKLRRAVDNLPRDPHLLANEIRQQLRSNVPVSIAAPIGSDRYSSPKVNSQSCTIQAKSSSSSFPDSFPDSMSQ